MTLERLQEIAEVSGEEITHLGGDFAECLVGVVWIAAKPMAAYDEELVLGYLMKSNGWSRDEALDWFGYNMDDGRVLYLNK